MDAMTYLTKSLNRRLEDIEAAKVKWIEKFTRDPAYALDGADSVFHRAAYEQAYRMFLANIEGSDLQGMYEWALQEMMHLAKYPSRSTEQSANLLHQHRVAAWTELVAEIAQLKNETV